MLADVTVNSVYPPGSVVIPPGKPPEVPGAPTYPIWGPPGFNPPGAGYPPGIGGGPIIPPPWGPSHPIVPPGGYPGPGHPIVPPGGYPGPGHPIVPPGGYPGVGGGPILPGDPSWDPRPPSEEDKTKWQWAYSLAYGWVLVPPGEGGKPQPVPPAEQQPE